MTNTQRVGYYCWGGPGLIRMLQTKYFSPRIDTHSLLRTYDYDVLQAAKETFGITDVWATLSWGFSDATEKEDWEFLRARLDNFHRLGLRVHAYIQGPNVVYREFPDRDWYCRDPQGRLIAYHRGRKLTCVNHPEFRAFLQERVRRACAMDIDGVFIDNAFLGQLGFPGAEPGCRCAICKKLWSPERTSTYGQFRIESLLGCMRDLAKIAHDAGKEFGSNSLDPRFDAEHVYGTDLRALADIQDYLLFETLTMPDASTGRGNAAVHRVLTDGLTKKPVFVVSYKKGIGFDGTFSQKNIDDIFSEAACIGCCPALKGSEYLTNGTWHNLNPRGYRQPVVAAAAPPMPRAARLSLPRPLMHAIGRHVHPLMSLYYENAFVRRSCGWVERMLIG